VSRLNSPRGSKRSWACVCGVAPSTGKECGPGKMDCSPSRMIAVSVAANPVLAGVSANPLYGFGHIIVQNSGIRGNMATTPLTRVGHAAASPASPLSPSPATGHAAEIPEVYDLYLSYDAETFPSKPPPWTMRSTSRAGLLAR
jgi:hypothetical protein